jgi:hypothetical protein
MKRRADTALTVALSLSLVSHAGLGVVVLRERIAELTGALHQPPLTDAELAHRDLPESPEADAAPIISDPPAQTVQDLARAQRAPAPKPLPAPQRPKPPVEENSEWGEKDANGIAVTSTPGTRDLSARKAMEDQAFASRDPEGPQPRPDEPSPSTALPGQNGDGKRPSQAALDASGTQSDAAAEPLGMPAPAKPYVPPPPVLQPRRAALARDDRGFDTPQTNGPSRSRLPSP